MNTVYQVCIPHTQRDYFDYLAGDFSPAVGSRVWVPFRHKQRLGLIISKQERETADSLKTIETLIDAYPLLSHSVLQLCRWVSNYYQAPLSEVIPLALPKKYREGAASELPVKNVYYLAKSVNEAKALINGKACKQHALVELLACEPTFYTKGQLYNKGFSQAQLKSLLEKNIIALSQQPLLPPPNQLTKEPPYHLNPEQEEAFKAISCCLQHYHCFLLQGVTGSGKTEVYFQLIRNVLDENKQVLLVVPEIGLTPQLLARFSARFSESMVVIHSNLNESERQIAWQLAHQAIAKIVIGTRSAVFTSMPALGLIIIDEEHDSSLKQMEGVRYSGRDTALMRAYFADIPIVLGSATPSLESLYNCQQGKYSLLRLNRKALASSELHYQVIDLRAVHLHHGLAPKTLAIISEHLQQGNQVLVFLNRRGFAPILLCHQCGWMANCHACDSHLTMHRKLGQLICHHCGSVKNIPHLCASCHQPTLLPIGTGTQRLEEHLQSQFPNTTLLRIDRDGIRRKNALNSQLEQIRRGEAQLIIGTQMLAKGHHFPRLTLAVIVDADTGFYNQDFRSLERFGQLLTQVAGRAGRAHYPGQVLIQTHFPQHPSLNLLLQQGYAYFAQTLLAMRKEAMLPPYHFLALIRAQDKHPEKVLSFLHLLKEALQKEAVEVLGPAPAPLARKALQHRMQLLVKSTSRPKLQQALTRLRGWLTMTKQSNAIRWSIDVDPVDLS